MRFKSILLLGVIFGVASAIYFYAHHNWNPLPPNTTIDRILVEKSARKLSIYRAGEKLKRVFSAGYDIMVHGLPNGRGWLGAFHRRKDWTAGCIALSDQEIEELWRVTPDESTIEILP